MQHASIIGVHFKPGGVFPFLNFPAGDLASGHVDLEACRGTAARFFASASARHIVHYVEQSILYMTHLGFRVELHPAPAFAILSRGRYISI